MVNTHGGHRKGAGRKPDLLKLGKSFLLWTTFPDGTRTSLEVVTVTSYEPVKGVELTDKKSGIVYHLDNGKRKRK